MESYSMFVLYLTFKLSIINLNNSDSSVYNMYKWFTPFHCLVVLHCMAVSQFVYPVVYWWTFRLFPFGASMNKYSSIIEYSFVYFHSLWYVFISLGEIPRSEVADRMIDVWLTFKETAAAAAAAAKSLQLYRTLWDPIDGSPTGSPVPGILQARTLEWLPFPSPMHESEK